MRTPRLNRRLTLEEPLRTPDDAGGHATAWTELGALWAGIDPAAPRLQTIPAAQGATAPLRITVRSAPPGAPSRPRPGQRFREGARIYGITAVQEADPTGRFLLCLAQEEAAL
jgi:head-tail adaptor